MEFEAYSPLKYLRVEIEGNQETFSFCFWLYLKSSPTFPATIIHQVPFTLFQAFGLNIPL